MCKSGELNYLRRIEATYKARSHEHMNTRVTYVSSKHSSEVSESHNPTFGHHVLSTTSDITGNHKVSSRSSYTPRTTQRQGTYLNKFVSPHRGPGQLRNWRILEGWYCLLIPLRDVP